MTTRILQVEEYPRLVGTELETVWAHLPAEARVVAVEDDGELVGCWAVLPITHVEGVWVKPSHRNAGGVARRLLRGMRDVAQEMGARAVFTAALTPNVEDLLARVGAEPLPGTHYVLALPRKD